MTNLPSCTGKLSVAGYHEFKIDPANCICGCDSNKEKCTLCYQTKEDLTYKNNPII